MSFPKVLNEQREDVLYLYNRVSSIKRTSLFPLVVNSHLLAVVGTRGESAFEKGRVLDVEIPKQEAICRREWATLDLQSFTSGHIGRPSDA